MKDFLLSIALIAALAGWAGSEYRWRCIDHKWSAVTDRWSAVSDRQAALVDYWRMEASGRR